MIDQDIREAFDRLTADVTMSVDTRSRLSDIDRRPRWVPVSALAAGFAVAALAIFGVVALLSAAAENPVTVTVAPDDPTPVTPPPSVAPSPAPSPVPSTAAPEEPDAVPPAGLQPGAVLIAGPEALFLAGDGVLEGASTGGADMIVGDGMGGFVIQIGNELLRWQSTGDPATVATVASASADERLRLMDLVHVNGEPWVAYVRRYGIDEAAREEVVVVSMADGRSRTITDRGAGEGGLSRVSYGGEVFVLTSLSEGESWLEFIDMDGNPVDQANPKPYEAFGPPYVDQAVLSADGTALALLWSDTNMTYDASVRTFVVFYDAATGEEQSRFELPAGEHRYVRLDWDGATAVLSRDTISSGDGEPGYAPIDVFGLTGALGDQVVTQYGIAGVGSLIKGTS